MNESTLGNPKQEGRQIRKEIDQLSSSMERLSDKITGLSQRLIPALRSKVSPPTPESETIEMELVLFATDIRSIRYSVERNTTSLSDILDRLEMP